MQIQSDPGSVDSKFILLELSYLHQPYILLSFVSSEGCFYEDPSYIVLVGLQRVPDLLKVIFPKFVVKWRMLKIELPSNQKKPRLTN